MNERIKELWEQAVHDGRINTSVIDVFAQLIVKECQTVVEWAISVDSTIDRVPMLIQEHFGVE